jgi:ribose transport system ATP-binding protein
MASTETQPIVVRGLEKSFGRNRVLHGLDLTIPPGEFVGLMGPNGAGKSTLIKILGGVYEASAGDILYGENRVRSLAQVPEVGFIHQDLGLIDALSIVDNLRLGEKPMRLLGPLLHRSRERAAARAAIARVKLDRDVDTLVGELSPGEKTLVAIARLLDRGARVLFVDEATSTLPPADSHRLIEALGLTVESGATVIMVTHKLSEIFGTTNRVIVLLDGVIAADEPASSLDRERLVQMLVAHESEGHEAIAARPLPGKELIRLEGVTGGRAGPIDLVLREREVVGLTGLPGSGLHDVGYLAHGATRPRTGRIVRGPGVKTAFVPPHRETQGGFTDLSVRTNLTLSSLPRWRHGSRLLKLGRERDEADEMAGRLQVKPSDTDAAYGTLSGGNKQKVIFGRVLFQQPNVYVLCEPTRGVDVGTRAEIYKLIRGLSEQGAAVLVITSDSEDLFAVCDRIAVVEDGRVGDFQPVDESHAKELEAFI